MSKVFLDCGANNGQSYDWFMENKGSDEWDVHCFEPSPEFVSSLSSKPMTYHQKAVWIEDGKDTFYVRGGLSSTLYKNKQDNIKKQPQEVEVDTIDFSQFIMDNFNKDDYIILKMDIEGGEYKVIDKMLEDKTFEYIDEFYVEFHGAKIQDLYPYFDEVYEREGVDAKTYQLQEIDKYNLKICEVYPYKTWVRF
jgi:FkbM family methyltransferase